jgi:hypothetical protein
MGGNFDVLQSRTLALEYSGYVGRNVNCLCMCSREIVVAGSMDGLIVMWHTSSSIPKTQSHAVAKMWHQALQHRSSHGGCYWHLLHKKT